MKKAKDLLNITSSIINEKYPELKEKREGLAPLYAKIIFHNRLKKGYSQEQLAKLANVDTETIYRVEGGYDNLSTTTYDKIFRSLGLNTNEIAKAMMELQAGNDELAITI